MKTHEFKEKNKTRKFSIRYGGEHWPHAKRLHHHHTEDRLRYGETAKLRTASVIQINEIRTLPYKHENGWKEAIIWQVEAGTLPPSPQAAVQRGS